MSAMQEDKTRKAVRIEYKHSRSSHAQNGIEPTTYDPEYASAGDDA